MPIYWAFLTYILLRPSRIKQESLWINFDHMDKVVHFIAFALLGFCYAFAFPKQRWWIFLGVMTAYALLTEVLQEIMALGRTMDTLDFLADILGVILGYFLYKKLSHRFFS